MDRQAEFALLLGAGLSLVPAAVYAQGTNLSIPESCSRVNLSTPDIQTRPQLLPEFESLAQDPQFLKLSQDRFCQGISTVFTQFVDPSEAKAYSLDGLRAHISPDINSPTLPADYWLNSGETLKDQNKVKGQVEYWQGLTRTDTWMMVGSQQYYASEYQGANLLYLRHPDFFSVHPDYFKFIFNPNQKYQISGRIQDSLPTNIRQITEKLSFKNFLEEQKKRGLDVAWASYAPGYAGFRPISLENIENVQTIMTPDNQKENQEDKNYLRNYYTSDLEYILWDSIYILRGSQVISKWIPLRTSTYPESFTSYVSAEIEGVNPMIKITYKSDPRVYKLTNYLEQS